MPFKTTFSKAIGPSLQGPPTTMYEMMKTASLQHPDNIAIISMHQPSDLYRETSESRSGADYLRWTHSQFRHQAELLALALEDLGLRKGEPIAIYLDNVVEWSLFFYATLLLNVPFVNCNPRSALNAEEVRHVIKTSGACALVATNEELAAQLEAAAPTELNHMKFKILLADEAKHTNEQTEMLSNYQRLGSLLLKAKNELDVDRRLSQLERIPRAPKDTILILFTSGTTSLPKGCEHTNETFSANLKSYTASLEVLPESVMCMNHAVNSVSGPVFNFSFLTSGATVVHPSLNFDAGASIRAVQVEKCSHMGTVTTMLQLCLEHPSLSNADISSLNIVFCGGSNVMYSHAIKCRDLLGAKLRIVYGLTEAPAATNGYAEVDNDSTPWNKDMTPSTGPPVPGAKIKICSLDTGDLVERGERGELHVSGPLVIQQYIGNASPESFYIDGDERWFRTGDEAVMDAAGEIRITGRYKDLILRGGANLSPASIENVVSKELGLDSQVVGVSDESAGEVPVAIVKAKLNQQETLSAVRQTVIRKLGKNYALEDVVLLSDLGLEDWPKTTSGKVRKTELRDLVATYRKAAAQNGDGEDGSDMASAIKETWSRLTGVPAEDIKDETSINELADSLTISRLATQLDKKLGQTVSLQDLLTYPTLQEQVTVLESRKDNPTIDLQTRRGGPPGVDDMIHTHGDEARALKTQEFCEQALNKMGLSWSEDVKDVMPAYDWVSMDRTTEMEQIHTTKSATVDELGRALKVAFEFSDMMRTIPIHFDRKTTLLVVLRPSERWYKNSMTTISEPLDKVDDLKKWDLDSVGPWGQPLVRVVIAHLRETDSAAFLIKFAHATGDGIGWGPFFNNIEMTLQDSNHKPNMMIPHKLFADEKYALRNSSRAQALISKYVRSLKGIKDRADRFWPPSTESPLWRYGDTLSQISRDIPEGFTRPPTGPVQDYDLAAGVSLGDRKEIILHDVRELQVSNGIPPAVLGKAALLLFIATQTQQSYVLIGEILAGRSSWPHTSKWISQRRPPYTTFLKDLPKPASKTVLTFAKPVPSPLDLDGPAYTTMPCSLEINKDMTIMDLLKQMTTTQTQLVEDCHLPQLALRDALNDQGDPDAAAKHHGDGDFVTNHMLRLILDWLPSMADLTAKATEDAITRCVHNTARPHIGVGILMGMKPDGKTLRVGGAWVDAALTDQERDDAILGILEMAQKISDRKNWGMRVGDLMES